MAEENKIRIQKYLSANGIASRRKAEQMVAEGLVMINNRKAEIGDKVTPGQDKIFVNNKKITPNREKKRYIMLNKPRGYITTLHDEKNRKCVLELIGEIKERIYPVGRLDRDSEGLLIMTNDGEFANEIMHPSKHVQKTYRVTLHSAFTDYHLAKFCTGVRIDGYMTAPAKARVILEEKERTVIEVTICEGKNRQIRRMCEAMNLNVARLKRVSVGGVRLGGLPVGKWRNLSIDEVNKLLSERPAYKNSAPGKTS